MPRIIFDSSFLMAVAEHPTTWMEYISSLRGKPEPILLLCVREELERISSGKGMRSKYARVALEMARNFKVEPCGDGTVDDEIASAAQRGRTAVATTDKDLAKTLRSLRVEVVGLRSRRAFLG